MANYTETVEESFDLLEGIDRYEEVVTEGFLSREALSIGTAISVEDVMSALDTIRGDTGARVQEYLFAQDGVAVFGSQQARVDETLILEDQSEAIRACLALVQDTLECEEIVTSKLALAVQETLLVNDLIGGSQAVLQQVSELLYFREEIISPFTSSVTETLGITGAVATLNAIRAMVADQATFTESPVPALTKHVILAENLDVNVALEVRTAVSLVVEESLALLEKILASGDLC